MHPIKGIYHQGDVAMLEFLLKIRSETFIHLLEQQVSFRLDNVGFDFVDVTELPYVYDSVLTNLSKRIGDLEEPVWVFHIERFCAMTHRSLHKLMLVIQEVLSGQGIPALQGVETLEWTAWEQPFGFAKQTGIHPNQLLQLEPIAVAYDWVLRQPDFPTEGTISQFEFRRDCGEYFFRQQLQNLVPIEFEYYGVPLLLEPVLDMGRIKLAFARRIHPKSPTEALELKAQMQKQGIVRFGM